MSLVTKITKLTRLPQLLKKKKEAEQESKKKGDDSEERPPFPLKDKPAIKKPKPSSLKKQNISPMDQRKSSSDDGIGEHLDLKA